MTKQPTNWLAQKAMLTSLSVSRWHPYAIDREVTDEVHESHNAAKDTGRYNKRLVDKSATMPTARIMNEARHYHMRMTQPWLDNASARILPAALYLDYTAQMNKFRKAFEDEVVKFVADYPQHVEKRKKAINGLFKADDYPSQDRLASLYGFEVTIMPCPDAGDFRVDLAAEHAEDIKAGIEATIKKALTTAMQEPMRRIAETVGHMAERLRTYQKGDRMFASMVDNVRDLVSFLPAFNLTDDPTLTALLARMDKELCIDVKELKENAGTRAVAQIAAEDILAKVKQYF
jgi:hypothetical protein